MKRLILLFLSLAVLSTAYSQRQSEELSRGLVAIKKSGGIYLGWRITGKEWMDVSYHIYRNGSLIKETNINDPSNYLDPDGSAGDLYSVAAVYKGEEQALSPEVTAQSNNYFDIQLDRPRSGTLPDGDFTYTPNDASVGDLDGDGEMDIILKWDPSNAHDNSHSGYTGDVIIDAYTLGGTHMWRINLGRNIRAGAHYTQFMVGDFDGNGKAELVCKTADGTVDGLGNVIGDTDADYRGTDGRILSGPEFLTIFNGETGEAMHTIDFQPARGSVTDWGDNYGNRSDRFLACTPYLDGEHPSIVMCRGYYYGRSPYKGKTVLAAYDFTDGLLTQRWIFTAKQDGINSAYTGQGNHNLSVVDVDNDGKDEIVYGAMTIDDDGTGLYSTGLGHGDALHVSDMDPDYPGFEMFSPHEDGENGVTFREAATGKIIWQHKKDEDVGRGVAADVTGNRGFESWATSGLGMYDAQGEFIGSRPSSINFRVYWDGDLSSELLDGSRVYDFSTTILQGALVASNNGSKSTPSLSADIFGDWREEIIWRHTDNDKLRIYTSTDITTHKVYTLLHDSQYRSAVAWQNVAYNQPPHLGFYMENDMALPIPQVFSGLKWTGNPTANQWDNISSNFEDIEGTSSIFNDGDTAIFSFNGINDPVQITGDISPGLVVVASPDDYVFEGSGVLYGSMSLLKSQKGSLTISGSHSYTGKTVVTDGALVVNGSLYSRVFVSGGTWGGINAGTESGGRLGGSGILKGGLVLQNRAALMPGMNDIDTLFVENGLEIQNKTRIYFDIPASSDQANDLVMVTGDLAIANDVSLIINPTGEKVDTGNYVLFSYTGTFSGSLEDLEILGLDGIYYELQNIDNKIILYRPEPRNPLSLVWTGNENSIWSLKGDINWNNGSSEDFFLPGDSAVFNESGSSNPEIEIRDYLDIAHLSISGTSSYTVSGEGTLVGTGGIEKNGTGTFKLYSINSFTGSTHINEGVLEIENLYDGDMSSNLGMAGSSADSLVLNGGELKINGYSTSDKGIKIADGGGTLNIRNEQQIDGLIEGSGILNKSGLGTLSISQANPFDGSVNLKGGTIEMLSDQANSSGLGTAPIIIENGTYQFFDSRNTFTTTSLNFHIPDNGMAQIIMDGRVYSNDILTGQGDLDLVLNYTYSELRGDWSAFTGEINILADSDGGDFKVNNDFGYANSSLTFNENVSAYHLTEDTIVIGTLNSKVGSRMNKATWEIGSSGIKSVLSGNIQGNSIIKKGSGRLVIDGINNTYTGGTIIQEGYLLLENASGSATGYGNLYIKEKALLGGSGSTASNVTIENGGYLSPGTGIGTLTINNTVTLSPGSIYNVEISNESEENDALLAQKIYLDNSILYMMNVSSVDYKTGDRFQIFNADSIIGSFANIYPKQPGDGLKWDTTNLYTFGLLEVTENTTSASLKMTELHPSIYPNPTHGHIYLDIPGGDRLIGIRLLNNSGQVIDIISSEDIESNGINLIGNPSGVYFIEIETSKQKTTRKVILDCE